MEIPLPWASGNVCRFSVEPIIREGRPHHRSRVRRLPSFPIRIGNRIAVDGDHFLLEASGIRCVGELASHDGTGLSFRAVVDKSRAAAHQLCRVRKLKRCLRNDGGVDKIPVGRARFFRVDIAQHHLRRTVEGRPSLDRGGAADESPRLHISQHGFGIALGQYPRRPTDIGLVTGLVRPVVMVKKGLLLRWLRPQRQCVVAEMIVQIDQSRNDKRVPCFHDRGSLESGGSARISRGDSLNKTVVSEIDSAFDHGRGIIDAHGNNAASDDECHRASGSGDLSIRKA